MLHCCNVVKEISQSTFEDKRNLVICAIWIGKVDPVAWPCLFLQLLLKSAIARHCLRHPSNLSRHNTRHSTSILDRSRTQHLSKKALKRPAVLAVVRLVSPERRASFSMRITVAATSTRQDETDVATRKRADPVKQLLGNAQAAEIVLSSDLREHGYYVESRARNHQSR